MKSKVKKSFGEIRSEIVHTNSIDCSSPGDLAEYLSVGFPRYIERGEISIEDALFEMFEEGTNYGGMM